MVLAEEGIKLPVITTLHGTDITLLGKDASFEPVISFAINKSDAVTAVSQSLKNDTYKLFGINQEIEVIPNFLNAEHEAVESSPDLRREYAQDNERIIIHMSNFRPVKRILDIIEVFASVQPAVASKLILLGDGPERSRAEQKCRELNIAEHVTFVGNLKQPQELLSIGDLFILPSESESFGLAALEAMASGLPVISTNTGGLPEVNRHGVTGMMSDVGDIEDMVKNCIYLLEDASRLSKFKRQAIRRAKDFSIDKILPLYEQLYQKVITHE
jgi:N-acetyl-alpha-D-glucosaminyl L-malate synthase BshA